MLNIRPILALCLTSWLIYIPPSHGQDPATSTAQSYFTALKGGDVSALRRLVDGPYHQEIKVLLEQNTEYPAFLQDRYAQVQFLIDEVITQSSGAAIKARYNFGPNDTQRKLLIVRPDQNGVWKVTEVQSLD